MNHTPTRVAALFTMLGLAACSGQSASQSLLGPTASQGAAQHHAIAAASGATFESLGCGKIFAPKIARCFGKRSLTHRRSIDAKTAAAAIDGYHPSDLQSAYGLTQRVMQQGGDQTIALIDAYDDPNAEQNLAVYRAAFGLPPCTHDNGCFAKVNQAGSRDPSTLPASDPDWAIESDIDIEMASAICPKCKIVLVEANSSYTFDLAAANDTAVRLGATEVSNSWGADEYPDEIGDDAHFHHAGVAIVAAGGDWGYGTSFPAVSTGVTAVGGTTLTRSGSPGPNAWTQSVWPATGAGCSAYIAKPRFQHDAGCANRTQNDLAVIGDPDTGVAIYHTFPGATDYEGWDVFGGTSVGTPVVAGMYALSEQARLVNDAAVLYANPRGFLPVAGGNDGTCSPAYLCTAVPGYNGPAGLGTPNAQLWLNLLAEVGANDRVA